MSFEPLQIIICKTIFYSRAGNFRFTAVVKTIEKGPI